MSSGGMHGGEEKIIEVSPSRWNYWHFYLALLAGSVFFPPAILSIPILEYYRKSNKLIVTNERLIKRAGLVTKKVDALRHDAIMNVHVGQSAMHRFMNIGTVSVGTQSANMSHLAFHGIYDPESVGDIIQKTLKEFHERKIKENNLSELNQHA